jgi:hypothetical protein
VSRTVSYDFKPYLASDEKQLPIDESEVCTFHGYLPFKIRSKGMSVAHPDKFVDDFIVDEGLQLKYG